jgi:hypothetical protein
MYHISKGIPKINPVEVDRVTDSSIWIKDNPRRRAKYGQWDNYYPTWQDAHARLLSIANNKVKASTAQLQQAQTYAEKVVALRP